MQETPEKKSSPEMEVAVLSEKGNREENQDWMSWSRVPWGECYIVADGMGGYKGGAIASRMTVEGIERYVNKMPPEWPFEKALQEAFQRTNQEVYTAAHSGDPATENMGSTVVVALVCEAKLQIGHVGDSRVYLFRKGQLKLHTKDHTSVQRMLDAGMLTPEQARGHPEAHVLSRAVGSKPEAEIEIGAPVDLEEGDCILLCSDGLSGYLDDSQIEKVVRRNSDVQSVPKTLIDLALKAGSDDNITVQFVRYGKAGVNKSRLTSSQLLPGGKKEVITLSEFGIRKVRNPWTWVVVMVLALVFLSVFYFNLFSIFRHQPVTAHSPATNPTAAPANGAKGSTSADTNGLNNVAGQLADARPQAASTEPEKPLSISKPLEIPKTPNPPILEKDSKRAKTAQVTTGQKTNSSAKGNSKLAQGTVKDAKPAVLPATSNPAPPPPATGVLAANSGQPLVMKNVTILSNNEDRDLAREISKIVSGKNRKDLVVVMRDFPEGQEYAGRGIVFYASKSDESDAKSLANELKSFGEFESVDDKQGSHELQISPERLKKELQNDQLLIVVPHKQQ